MHWPGKWLIAGTALTVPAAAPAAETVTYVYDALGRLVAVSTAGGPNDGLAVSTDYDPAGNRASYGVAGAGAAGSTAPAAGSAEEIGTVGAPTGLDEQGGTEGAAAACMERSGP